MMKMFHEVCMEESRNLMPTWCRPQRGGAAPSESTTKKAVKNINYFFTAFLDFNISLAFGFFQTDEAAIPGRGRR